MQKHKDLVKKFYDRMAPEYHNHRYVSKKTVSSYAMLNRKNVVMRLIDSIKIEGNKLLDIGCGAGSYVPEFIQRGYEVWGIDISPKMIEQANRMLIKEGLTHYARFCQGDIENLSFPLSSFDIVVVVGVIEYLETDRKVVKEIYRVTKPKGIVVITLNNKRSYSNFRTYILKPIKSIISPYFPNRVSCSEFTTKKHTPKQFINFMKSYDFSFMTGEYCNFNIIPYDFRVPKVYFRFTKLMERLLKFIGLDIIFGTYIAVFKKN